ncbi:Uncharacterised protein [Mycolicibacterium vanbaalenii]|uniref:Uncharacterized protein n=1 Tax=Mycolicibacterium vanbaalenii TaxID=110539 RepID=A0A5S9R6I2_MYCVN|nr:Uncharacterised protein [Mycolicibacterium vanbaalenii]
MTETSASEAPLPDSIGLLVGDEPGELTPTRSATERGLIAIGAAGALIFRHSGSRL